MKHIKTNKQSGFTLLEMILVMGLIGIVLAVVGTIQISGLRAFQRQTGISMSHSSLEVALADITRSLRNTTEEDFGEYANGLAADGNVYQCRDGALYKNNELLVGSVTELSSRREGRRVTVTLTLASGDTQDIVVSLRR